MFLQKSPNHVVASPDKSSLSSQVSREIAYVFGENAKNLNISAAQNKILHFMTPTYVTVFDRLRSIQYRYIL